MTTNSADAPRPAGRDIHFREFVALCACLMAMNALSTDPMLPALPDIARDLHLAHANDRQLIISVYFLGTAVGTLLFGTLSDRFGRKRVFATALVLFILSTIACAGAHNFTMLLVGRACSGFFAASSRVITVSIVRDRFQGDTMARVMSLIFGIFMIVPILAPGMGQAVLWVAPWRWIFWVLALVAATILLWMLVRLPETLRPENRVPISLSQIGRTIAFVVTTRQAIGYMLAASVVMSGLVAFIMSVQQILFDTFGVGRYFPIIFAGVAGCMGLGSFINSSLVQRLGARRLSQGALLVLIVLAAVRLVIIAAGGESVFTFVGFQAMTMLTIAFAGSNFNAISMEPFARGAGAASSFQAFLTSIISAGLGSAVAYAYDGSTLPLTLGLLGFGLAALAIIWWTEGGKLFTRPNRAALREQAVDPVV
jgi:DHA1 family bicyclomycin/chloramphenicol resistance-like MFS transporter